MTSEPDLEEERVHAVVAARLFGTDEGVPKIGRFTVIERVGRGGMGDVYAAYDPQLDRRVALKLLHRTTGDERLLREARTMASTNHPNVAQVYEVGFAGPRVFIAMEFVQGQTLRAWREAATRHWREILALYRQAASGLAAAHAAGTIHGDFKPDNALIGDDGRVRVVDFGLSRVGSAVDETLDRQRSLSSTNEDGNAAGAVTGTVAGTPAYMAPEQFRGGPVDPRSDQFAFCVALHEALHGAPPYRRTSVIDLLRRIEEHEIDREKLDASIPDWIVRPILRGLSPDPRRRHASMQALIGELDRDPSRRRRLSFALGTTVVAAAVALGWRHTTLQRTAAECRARGRAVSDVWNPVRVTEIEAALVATEIPYAGDTWSRLQPRLSAWAKTWAATSTDVCTSERIDRTIGPGNAEAARACLAEELVRFSAVLDELTEPNATVLRRASSTVASLSSSELCLDAQHLARRSLPPADEATKESAGRIRRDLARAEALLWTASYDESLAIAQGALEHAETLDWQPLVAEARRTVGLVQRDLGQLEPARASLQQAFYSAGSSGQDDVAVSAANALVQTVGFRLADYDEGLHWYALGRMHARRLGLADDSPDLATLLVSASTVHIGRGDYDEAESVLTQALAIQERSLGTDHPDVANTLVNLGALHHTRGAYDEALALFEKALEHKRRTFGSEHPDVAMLLNNIAVVHRSLGGYAEALEVHELALDLRRRALGSSHPDVAASLVNIGNVHFDRGAYTEALAAYENAADVQREASGPGHPDLAKSLGGIGKVHYARGEYDEALAAAEEALSIAEAALGPDHVEVGEAANLVAVMHQAKGATERAMDAQQRALAIWESALGSDHPMVAMAYSNIGVYHRILNDPSSALAAHRKALAIREHQLGGDHTDVAASLTNVGNAHADLGELGDALDAYERALEIYEKALGPDHPLVATVVEGIAMAQVSGDAHAEAIAGYERALAIRERAEGDPADLATTRFELAKILWRDRVDRKRAIDLARRARASFTELGTRGAKKAEEIESWLLRH